MSTLWTLHAGLQSNRALSPIHNCVPHATLTPRSVCCKFSASASSVSDSTQSICRYHGWFWGHFCHDLFHRLAVAVDYLGGKREQTTFKVIIESQSHANVLALIQYRLCSEARPTRESSSYRLPAFLVWHGACACHACCYK